jgi:exportin-2 (importin alpha re-exporter)
VVQGGHLEGVLGVFQKLLASRVHDHEGFFLLNSLMEFLPLDVFRGYLPTIWTLLFRRYAPCAMSLEMV